MKFRQVLKLILQIPTDHFNFKNILFWLRVTPLLLYKLLLRQTEGIYRKRLNTYNKCAFKYHLLILMGWLCFEKNENA